MSARRTASLSQKNLIFFSLLEEFCLRVGAVAWFELGLYVFHQRIVKERLSADAEEVCNRREIGNRPNYAAGQFCVNSLTRNPQWFCQRRFRQVPVIEQRGDIP